jgi:ribA/ribD-fused uncharacterized protein
MTINSFRNEHRWLSNFFPAVIIFADGKYPTVEHAFQAAKTRNKEQREEIRRAETATYAKQLGRNVDLRNDWHDVKLMIMHNLIWQKFTRHPTLRQLLLDTGGTKLVEGNNWNDTYWGICRGVGENQLGRIIMNVRDKINNGDDR